MKNYVSILVWAIGIGLGIGFGGSLIYVATIPPEFTGYYLTYGGSNIEARMKYGIDDTYYRSNDSSIVSIKWKEICDKKLTIADYDSSHILNHK